MLTADAGDRGNSGGIHLSTGKAMTGDSGSVTFETGPARNGHGGESAFINILTFVCLIVSCSHNSIDLERFNRYHSRPQ
jgi:hypothetical protein